GVSGHAGRGRCGCPLYIVAPSPDSCAGSAVEYPRTSTKTRAAAWRAGIACSAVTNASSMVSRRSTRAWGSSGYGCTHVTSEVRVSGHLGLRPFRSTDPRCQYRYRHRGGTMNESVKTSRGALDIALAYHRTWSQDAF